MKILFQGDSITDAGRSREDLTDLGPGYPSYAAKFIKEAHPDMEFEFVNRGVSGNKVSQLIERLQEDFIDLKPDVVSVLIGVNDTWHHANIKDWIPNDEFEAQLRKVYSTIKDEMGAKLIVLEDFLLPQEWSAFFREDLDPKMQIIRKLAREYADVYVPLDGLFAAGCIEHKSEEFSSDSVHPTAFGAEFIGKYYKEAFDKIL